jgi:hypothetical protein
VTQSIDSPERARPSGMDGASEAASSGACGPPSSSSGSPPFTSISLRTAARTVRNASTQSGLLLPRIA